MSYYGTYNAKHFSPTQVAESFIPCAEYYQLRQLDSTVLLGARGSGKTTLMKMLTPEGNSKLKDKTPSITTDLPFWGIYIPTDIQWHHQLKYSDNLLVNFPTFSKLVSKAAVTLNILISVVECMEALLAIGELKTEQEPEIAELMLHNWKLGSGLPKFSKVKRLLYSCFNDLTFFVNKKIHNKLPDSAEGLPDFVFIEYLSAISSVLSSVQEHLITVKKWALCFDELEMAPLWLQEELFTQLRCLPNAFVYKLSTAPIPLVVTSTSPSPTNDYSIVRVWPQGIDDRFEFCEKLCRSLIYKKFNKNIAPKQLFGKSFVYQKDGNTASENYSAGSVTTQYIRLVAENDPSLRRLLSAHGIDWKHPFTTDVKKRDQVLRKLKPIVYQKVACLKWDKEGHQISRSRKIIDDIYSGTEAIYKISDGNPRRLIAIVNQMLEVAEIDKNGTPKPISPETQASVLNDKSRRFSAYIRGIPESIITEEKGYISLFGVIKKIAEFFYNSIVTSETTLDPPGSFTIDSKVDESYIRLLKVALDHGIIVLVDPFTETIESSLKEKRYRLSYMLAPAFKLPLRLYSSVNLTSMLRAQKISSKIKYEQIEILFD